MSGVEHLGEPLAGRSVLVAGLGASGAAAAAALARAGAAVEAIDAGQSAAASQRAQSLEGLGVGVRLGVAFDQPRLLDGVELVVASPGVAQSSPLLVGAARRGTPVWSEPELAWRLSRGRTRLVGVTGTNGKTTTTEMLAACLGAASAGNIGTPLVEVLAGAAPPPLVVAELSSFQLRFTQRLRASVAVLVNVAPDHLDWHGGMDAYRAAKARIWAAQEAGDVAVCNADDPGALATRAAHPPPAGNVSFTTAEPGPGQVGITDGWIVARGPAGDATAAPQPIAAVDTLDLRGGHNVANACAAAAAALAAGAEPASVAAGLKAYRPGEHRLQRVASGGGVDWIDDSKATNPHAAAAALATVVAPVVWIAGGLNKGLDFHDLEAVLPAGVRLAITIGTSGAEIAALTRRLGIVTVEAGDLAQAVATAARHVRPGDTVLLAPACASMDQFTDYAHRGRVFAELAIAASEGSR